MKKRPISRNSCRGFTLIEVILTLVLIAFAGLMLMELTGTTLTKSMIPIQWTREEFILKQKVEHLTSEYVRWVNTNNTTALLSDWPFQTIAGTDSSNTMGKFITFTCIGKNCTEDITPATGVNRTNLKVTLTEGDMNAVIIFSQMKSDNTMYINY